MKQLLAIYALFAVIAGARAVTDDSESDDMSPAERYRELLREYNRTSSAVRTVKTDEERRSVADGIRAFALRFAALADSYPRDPIALTALRQAVQAVVSGDSAAQRAWEMNRTAFPRVSSDDSERKIVELLRRNHARSPELDKICDRIRYSVRSEFIVFLRETIRSSPHRKVRAEATLALARILDTRLHMLDLLTGRPDLHDRYEALFGKSFVESIRAEQRPGLAKSVEVLFVEAAAYDDVNAVHGGPIGAQAERELYECRHLAVGKRAPDIEGFDQDGERFKLSDYRGKVVLLNFWLEY